MSLLIQAADYLGNYALSSVVYFKFSVTDATGVLTTLGGTPAVKVYKDNGTTESTAGVTLTVDFDSRTGLCQVAIDTSSDGTFYAAGHEFEAVLTAGTVGIVSVAGTPVGHFSLLNRVTTLADGVPHGGTPGSSTATMAFSRMVGHSQTTDTPAFSMTGNGTGAGGLFQGGATDADGLDCVGGGTNGTGLGAIGAGSLAASAGWGVGFLAFGIAADGTGFWSQGVGSGGATQFVGGPTGFGWNILAGQSGNGDAINLASHGSGHDINLAGSGDMVGKLAADSLDNILIDGKTLPAALQIIAALVAGKVTGAGTTTETFIGLDGIQVRATVTADASGNRTNVVYG